MRRDSWCNVISGCVCEGALEDVSVRISGSSEEDPPLPMWAGIMQAFEGLSRGKKAEEGGNLCLLELCHPSSPALGHQSSWILGLGTPGVTPVSPPPPIPSQAFSPRVGPGAVPSAPQSSGGQAQTALCHRLSSSRTALRPFSASMTACADSYHELIN